MKNNRPVLPNSSRIYSFKRLRYVQRTFNKISEIQTVLLKGHSCFEETLKKKKNWWTTKWTTFHMTKLDLEVLCFSQVTVQNRMWNENITILENFHICQWFKVMKRLNLATWQILLLLEYSGLANWNLRQFIFNAIIPGYMEK